jgi:hypothetical protein
MEKTIPEISQNRPFMLKHAPHGQDLHQCVEFKVLTLNLLYLKDTLASQHLACLTMMV